MAITVKQVLEALRAGADYDSLPETVDRLLAGDEDHAVQGIAVTFMATQEVIEQAAAQGANLILSHEGAFYRHRESEGWLERDPVGRDKRSAMHRSGVTIFRLHDYIHRYKPDMITQGLVEKLGWTPHVDAYSTVSVTLSLPPMNLRDVAGHIKARLGLPSVRAVGDGSMICTRVGLLVGYRGGGDTAIPLFENEQLDLIIAGEGPEWETPEYVRDAVYQGKKKALILLGHAPSEEPGMELLAARLQSLYPEVPVHFIAQSPLFQLY
ncbi:putative NIF3 family GTP cyclohydrolase 1 type 2 [Fontibacillus phaseoli]|uniref:GTP cyclohydrolase 1 type 2 homolog n=1 Tax=Fontibacillus phaseoli TaxID=1416533 RepID=A0A369B4S4_9BACL|nr:Nif3-like dinuclear metal center hexameric protein [Fontibacillus phaseoli]RCX16441.1 putative NIF3 family GTP cyclohydrolase 1 type 2 [Fontibacillus phaseoli]